MSAATIHSSAIVEEGAQIGADTQIWHWVHVRSGAIVGARCNLGQNVYVADTARLGDNVHVQNNVSIYDGVTLQADVFCGPSMVFTNVKVPRARYPQEQEQYLPTLVKQGASLGANCTIVCGVTIGHHAMVGAGAVVIADVPDYALVVGVSARQIGWVSERGERLELPLGGQGDARCLRGGELYCLRGDRVFTVQ